MEDQGRSWVRRTKFSQTVCHRLDTSTLRLAPFSVQPGQAASSSSSVYKDPTLKSMSRAKTFSNLSAAQSERSGHLGNTKQRAPSPPPAIRSSGFGQLDLKSSYRSLSPLPALRNQVFHQSSFDTKIDYKRPEPKRNPQSTSTSKQSNVDRKADHKKEEPLKKSRSSPQVASEDTLKSPKAKQRSRSPIPSKYFGSLHVGSQSNDLKWSKLNRRALSPTPTSKISETFKEARSESKRFSTPAPQRTRSDRGVVGKFLYREYSGGRASSSQSSRRANLVANSSFKRDSGKSKNRKDTSWEKYFDPSGGRVTAVETAEEWMVDLSKLYLGQKFASGAHSRLYHGIYKEQSVAVKMIAKPENDNDDGTLALRLEKQFSREVTILSHLHHRNVLKLVGACRQAPVFCIITEYLSGGSLRAFLHKLENKNLPLDKLISVALDIARGMEYIHSQGVFHRDLKPENILFDQDLCVKIADFGIACEEAYCEDLAEDQGTFRWMAPEMIKHKPYGRKVDVYSFGLIMWEMLTGRIPYEEMTPYQAAFAVVDKNLRPVIPPDCPAPMRTLIDQCWSLLPEKRPDFWQIVKVLEEFESSLAHDGTLNNVQNPICQESKKNRMQWIQKLKPAALIDNVGQPAPKLH